MKCLMLVVAVMLLAAFVIVPAIAQQELIPWDTGHPITCYGRLETGPHGVGLAIVNVTQRYGCAGVVIEKTSNGSGHNCKIGDECQITDELAGTWYFYEKEGTGQISTCTGHAAMTKDPSANQPVFSIHTPDKSICYFPSGSIYMVDDAGQQCRIGVNGYNVNWPLCHATGYLMSTMHLLGKGWVH
jgi:hypothetical protein